MIWNRYLQATFGESYMRALLIYRARSSGALARLQLSSQKHHAAISRQLQFWVALKMKRGNPRQRSINKMALHGFCDSV